VTEREQVLTRSAETVVLGAALLMLAIASDGDHWVTAGVAGLLIGCGLVWVWQAARAGRGGD